MLIGITAMFMASSIGIDVKIPAEPFECGHIRTVCFDRDGSRFITVTQRGELLFWEKGADRPVVIPLEKNPDGTTFGRGPFGVSFDHAGRHAMLFYYDGRAQVWDVDARRKVKDLAADRKGLANAKISPDGKLLACLSREPRTDSTAILFWNTKDWSPAGRIDGKDTIYDYCFMPEGDRIVAAVGYSTDRKDKGFTGLVTYDLATKKDLGKVEYGTGFPVRLAISPDGRWVATGGGDAVPVGRNSRRLSGHLRVFDWEKRIPVADLYTLPSDYVNTVGFSPDSKHLYAGAYTTRDDKRISAELKAFSTDDWREAWTVKLGPDNNPHDCTVSPDGTTILVADNDHLHVVNAFDGSIKGQLLKFRFYPEDRAGSKGTGKKGN
jgi:WD40 repeat protein